MSNRASNLRREEIVSHRLESDDLRAEVLLDAGWDIADVQVWIGHADIKSTQVYAKVTNKRRETRYAESLSSDAIAANDAG